MAEILLYIGIGLTVVGWFALSWFALKQIGAQKKYDRMPQKWAEIKQGLVHKRQLCRWVIIGGLVVVALSLLFA